MSNLLEGVVSSSKAAMEPETNEVATSKNSTGPFRWLGFGRGDRAKGERADGEERRKKKKRNINDAYVEINSFRSIDKAAAKKGPSQKSKRSFGARTITGLVMALAEEAEGLEVDVDADPSTPLWNKSIRSIDIRFNRLGTRQLRMGGLDRVLDEIEGGGSGSIATASERFALARSFFDVGKPTTADATSAGRGSPGLSSSRPCTPVAPTPFAHYRAT